MNAVLTIAGVPHTWLFRSLTVNRTANGCDTFTVLLVSDGSYRPSLDDEIILVAGVGTSVTALAIGAGAKTFTVPAGLSVSTGERLRAWSAAGVTNWMEGPVTSYAGTTLALNVDATSGAGTYADWVVGRRIFGGLIQKTSERGANDASMVSPVEIRIEASDFNGLVDRRYITVSIPAGMLKAALLVVEPYLTTYGVALDPTQVNGPNLPALEYTRAKAGDVFTELATLSGYVREIDYHKVLRMYAPGTRAASFNLATGDGHAIGDVTVDLARASGGMVYANRIIVQAGTPEVPIVAQADDAGEQAAHGLWEIVIAAPAVFDLVTAQALADAYLLQRTPTQKAVSYPTREHVMPGQTQTINLPDRNVNNTFLVTEVVVKEEAWDYLTQYVTALEGSMFQPGWRNLYQQWLSPLTQGTVVPGTAGAGRTVHFLGGSSVEFVQSPTPDWVAASAIEVTLDTLARGSASATVTVRLRATAGTIMARLRNLSDGTTVGTSSVVASTTWETVTFAVTLTAGSKIYELQVLPSLADTDVAAVGYLE